MSVEWVSALACLALCLALWAVVHSAPAAPVRRRTAEWRERYLFDWVQVALLVAVAAVLVGTVAAVVAVVAVVGGG